ncbi:Glycosyl transferases group 1 [Actinacidiphila rubida]|uniref:Glycosyl transferases group 1 n=2 Tax=Actinacidiphila rubida TaxID=310780 RepID=A0A1H8N6L1_9ACTN|nr:glycosyltransferase family 4 protein [Actinacidiphila rubida]SEO25119.1 Glycosyl transferases group 1 [Actinacidiphila rubida]
MTRTGVRRLLLVTTNYAPEPAGTSRYATQIAEHWAAGGAEVHVLTGMPHYPAWRLDPAYAGKREAEEERGGVRVHRHGHTVPSRQTALSRARFEASLLRGALAAAPRIEGLERLDAVAAQMPSLAAGVVGARLAARHGVPFVPVVRNLLGTRAAVARLVERRVLRQAAVVGAAHETLVGELAALGVPQDRIRLVPNWSLTPRASRPREQMRAMLGWRPGQTVLMHCGDPGDGHGLELLVDAARTDPTLRVVVLGDAAGRERLRARAGGLPPNLDVAPLPDDSELPEMLAAADVLAVTDPGVPAELTSCFAAGRPIVAVVPEGSGTGREVAQAGAGLVVPPGTPGPLLAATRALAAEPERGASGPVYAAAHLTREAGLARIDELLSLALAPPPAPSPLPPMPAAPPVPAEPVVPPMPAESPATGEVRLPPMPAEPPAETKTVEPSDADEDAVH